MPGGLLRYGIPNFKLHKPIIDRRIRVMEEEGIHFKMNNDVDVRQLPEGFDATASAPELRPPVTSLSPDAN